MFLLRTAKNFQQRLLDCCVRATGIVKRNVSRKYSSPKSNYLQFTLIHTCLPRKSNARSHEYKPALGESIQHLFSYLRTQNVTEMYSITTFLRLYFPIAQINYLLPSVKQCFFQNARVPNRTMSKKTAEVNGRVINFPTLY
jgi:hypothetical protein